MLRAIRLALGAAIILVTGTTLAQPGKEGPAEGYFPLKKGTTWTYDVGENKIEVKVAKVDKMGNEEHYTLETLVGKDPKTTEVVTVKTDGVYRVKAKDDKLNPPVKVLALPLKKDASWDVNSKLGAQVIKGNLKIIKLDEEVTVPLGKFMTVHVEGKDIDFAGTKTTVHLWFAKDRGIVQAEFIMQNNEKVLLKLSKFEEGK
ncbi:MAG: hypothetical protein L0241_03690 [Planctomycetia bacterium]|nr:hypothetical protein [Planctomycetia bacterium]